MRVNEYPNLLVSGDMSGNLLSAAMPVTQGYIGSIQAVWTGSPEGTLTLFISNDGVTYSLYTGSSISVTTAGDFLWNLVSCGFNFVKLRYTFASGTGTLNVSSSYKGT